MTIIFDHNKRRYHGQGAVYFVHSMTPCILWSVILTLPVAAVKSVFRSRQARSACPGLTQSATELCGQFGALIDN